MKAWAADDAKLATAVEKMIARAEGRARGGRHRQRSRSTVWRRARLAVNPFNGETLPIWVANYILADYGTGAIMSVPAHDERDFEFATKYGLPIKRVVAPATSGGADDDSGDLALPYTGEDDAVLVNSGEWTGEAVLEAQEKMGRFAEEQRLRQAHDDVSAEGLGCQPPALLGHADPDGVLRSMRASGMRCRDRAGAGERAAGAAAGEDRDYAAGRKPARQGAGVREHDLPEVRRAGAARDRHDGHVRRFELVLLPLHRRAERERAVRFGEGELLVSDRSVHRRRGARDSSPDLLALLDEGDARSGDDQERRAGDAAVHAGHGDQRRREDVEVEGQCGAPG